MNIQKFHIYKGKKKIGTIELAYGVVVSDFEKGYQVQFETSEEAFEAPAVITDFKITEL